MAEVTITIGGRSFQVVCQEGQEEYLYSAAEMLDTEASKLDQAGSRITESRMLLMSGLMLADRTAALEDQVGSTGNSDTSSAVADERAKASRAETELAQAREEIAQLKSEASRAQSKLDETNLSGAQDMHAELEASRAEVASLSERLKKLNDASSDETDEISAEVLKEARTKQDAAVKALSEAKSSQKSAEDQRDAAIAALRRVVNKIEAVAE